ncbi:uncharacterized protein LOC109606069 isoform X2 [Aethina tumida]|uniref:uncharacterized protein LOC109606069 isoform X2 n=1 Tax=Aethina tumida TaxID=116153 RepID=UPI002147BBD8|nr:uncharacterized protein LOC109606069 isoform X2 [Aethina tumida]
MPRTKVNRTKKLVESKKPLPKEIQHDIKEAKLMKEQIQKHLDETATFLKSHISTMVSNWVMDMPIQLKNATYGDLKKSFQLNSTTQNFTSSVNSTIHSIQTAKKKRNVQRSSSLNEDDAESVSSSSGRMSRSRNLKTVEKSTRVSRSLSRSKTIKSTYKTPMHRQPTAESYGLVTPKVKPNTPQVIMRKPKQGEMVLSLSGSPLYTGSVVSETNPNVNIPLQDGRHITVHPLGHLRKSMIPELDSDTLRHLAKLRDNLNALVGVREENDY